MQQKKLHEIENDLEKAVFLACYNSFKQRLLRILAVIVISAKHGVRGLLYVWPLTLLVFIRFGGYWYWLKVFLILLAVAAWFRFIYRSVRDDYLRFVHGEILNGSFVQKVL